MIDSLFVGSPTTNTERGIPTCGAARPTPLCSIILFAKSSASCFGSRSVVSKSNETVGCLSILSCACTSSNMEVPLQYNFQAGIILPIQLLVLLYQIFDMWYFHNEHWVLHVEPTNTNLQILPVYHTL